MVNIIKHLPEIRSKTKTLKNLAKDLLANIKILCFIPMNKFDNFYKIIVKKFRVKFPKFFKYFNKNYIKGRIFDKTIWNYSNVILNSLNNDIIFSQITLLKALIPLLIKN